MNKELILQMQSQFDSLAQTHPEATDLEFWFARDLQEPLGYACWENFLTAIQRAIDSCETTGYEVGYHFRGVTKMIPQLITQRFPSAGFYQRSSSQGFLDYSNRGRSRVTEDSTATASSAAHGVFTPLSQGKATIKESLTVQSEELQRATVEESSVVQTTGGKGIGRAFSPREIVSNGFLGRCPRLVWRWAFGPETQAAPRARFHASISAFGPETQAAPRARFHASIWAFGPETQAAPRARFHTSLGQGPRYKSPTQIEG